MPIGKDSITKRVAKTTTEEKIAPELVATTAAAPAKKAPAKKSTSTAKKTTEASTAKKTTSTAKKPAAKKTAPKAENVATPVVETAVLANVAPETVAAVVGHEEKSDVAIIQIGGKLPTHLL